MAIIYGKDTAKDYASGNLASFGKSYSRMGAAPLDMYEVWYDWDALVAYASFRGNDANGNPVYDNETEVVDTSAVVSYVGQKVAYVDDEAGKIYHYSIQLDGSLKEIGVVPVGDDSSISVSEDGLVTVYGFAGAEAGTVGVKENGKIVWKKIEEIAPAPVGDGKSVVVNANTKEISLKGFAELTDAAVGYLPRIKRVGAEPATETGSATASITLAETNREESHEVSVNLPEGARLLSVEFTSVESENGEDSDIKEEVNAADYVNPPRIVGNSFVFTSLGGGIETYVDVHYNYTYTLDTETEYGLEIEWVPISAVVEGDGNTKTVVTGDGNIVKYSGHNELTDTHTYEIDVTPITDRLDTLEGGVNKEGSVEYKIGKLAQALISGVDEDGNDYTVAYATDANRAALADEATADAAGNIITETYETKTDAEGRNKTLREEFEGAFDTLKDGLTGSNGMDVVVVAEATKATQDGAGDIITETYETKTDAANKLTEAKNYAKGLVDAIPEQTDYTVSVEVREDAEGDNHSAFKHYIFTQCNNEIAHIDIPKDLVVKSGTVETVTEENKPYEGAKVGDKYIKLVIANQEAPLYIPAKNLVDIYTAMDMTGVEGADIQITIDSSNEISAVLIDGGIIEQKLHDDVKTKLNKVWEEVGVAEGLVNNLAGNVYTKTEIDAEVEALEGAIADEVEAREALAEEVAGLKAVDNATQAELDEYKLAVTEEIRVAKEAAISDADGKLNTYKGEVTETLKGYYNKTEIDGKVDTINTAIENEGKARGELATEVANDKQALADYKTEMTTALGNKVDAGTIAHTSESVEEGVTRNGTTLNIVVDAYKKEETYTKGEVDSAITKKIQDVTGGENASAVKLALNDYIKANDTEIYGATKVAEWTVDGVYTPDYTKDSRLDSLKGQADGNARDILALQNTVNGTADNEYKDGLTHRLSKLETEVRTDVDQRLDTAEGAISGLTEVTGTHTSQIKTLNETTIPGLQVAINEKVAQGDFDALDAKVNIDGKLTEYVAGEIAKIPEYDDEEVRGLISAEADRAGKAEAANKAAIEAIYKADEGEAAATGLLAEEIARAKAAEQANADDIVEINALLNTISDTDSITSLKELAIWVEEHETEVLPVIEQQSKDIDALELKVNTGDKNVATYVADAIAGIPMATATALGLVKSATDVDGKVAVNKVYVGTDGVGEVKAVSTDLLVQGNLTLVLNAGEVAINPAE